MTKTEIRLSGKGGQGIIKSAVILADAALRDGYNVIQSQDYGPQSRGGASKGEVIISSEAIYYPKVELPDIVVCLSQEACDKYAYHIAPDGVLIIDGDHCSVDAARLEGRSVRKLSIILTAKEAFNSTVFVGTVALGALIGITGAAKDASVRTAIKAGFKAAYVDKNLGAYETGRQLTKNIR
jgi:2-oxoglutarate ferredoxin oxidoreductase subunit gamma